MVKANLQLKMLLRCSKAGVERINPGDIIKKTKDQRWVGPPTNTAVVDLHFPSPPAELLVAASDDTIES